MANKTPTKQASRPAQKNNDAAVYKVMAALALLCGVLLGLRALHDYYYTVEGFAVLYELTPVIAGAGLGLAAIGALLLALRKLKPAAPWVLAVGLLTAVTGWQMRESGVEAFSFLYFLAVAMLVQYIIFQLYRWEFFLFSLSTVTAGGLFFSLSRGIYWTGKNIALVIVLVLVLAGTAWCAWNASQNKGWLTVGKVQTKLLSSKSLPILIIMVDVLWLICAIAAFLLGGLFAYYCMFAAIAVEFIGAVYYTFQLN